MTKDNPPLPYHPDTPPDILLWLIAHDIQIGDELISHALSDDQRFFISSFNSEGIQYKGIGFRNNAKDTWETFRDYNRKVWHNIHKGEGVINVR